MLCFRDTRLIRCKESESPAPNPVASSVAPDVIMLNSECPCPPNVTTLYTLYAVRVLTLLQSMSCSQGETFGCPLLQSIQSQINSSSYVTTAGEYLDTIFIHRSMCATFPRGHVDCARGFSDLAASLERRRRRGWRADWDEDGEAVKAFSYEAWVVASSM